MSDADNIVKAIQSGSGPDQLIIGSPLLVEDLDLSGIGMYNQDQKDKLLSEGVLEDDFFLKTLLGDTMWARKSDEGKKWHIYEDKLVDWSKIDKKE